MIPAGRLTCFFWFSRGYCDKGHRCKFAHELTDYVASYSPQKGKSVPMKVVRMGSMEETREATLAADPNRPIAQAPLKLKNEVAYSTTPIVDVLLDPEVPVRNGSAHLVVNSILKSIRLRRDQSHRVGQVHLHNCRTIDCTRISLPSCTTTRAN